MRLTVRRLSDMELEPSRKIFVKLNKYKFPAIIPINICEDLSSESKNKRNKIVALLSLISLFRVLPTKVLPETSTITKPFNGISKSLDTSLIKEALLRLNLRMKEREYFKFKLTLSQKAGPNGKLSLLNTGIDALAFIRYPTLLINYFVFNKELYGIRGIIFSI